MQHPQSVEVSEVQQSNAGISTMPAHQNGLAPAVPQNPFQVLQSSRADALAFFARYPDQMTLDALCEAGLPVYVQNNLARAGRVAVDFEISGKTITVTIPNGWLPVCLNDRMNPNDIRASGSLRDTLRKGAIIILHPTVAMELINSPRGQRELAKIRSEYAKATNVGATADNPSVSRTGNVEGATEQVTGRMQMLVIELEKAGTDAGLRQDILDKIFANTRSFTFADIEFFKLKTPGDTLAQAQAQEMFAELEKRSTQVVNSFKG
jgi:hypothetical protein